MKLVQCAEGIWNKIAKKKLGIHSIKAHASGVQNMIEGHKISLLGSIANPAHVGRIG